MFIDAHNHLQDEWLLPYRSAILKDLDAVGISRAVVNGTTEADWPEVAALARQHPWVLPSFGLHPWFIATRTPHWRERLIGFLDCGRCAVGEIGLDRWVKDYNFEDQKEVFTAQLDLAAERNLPVTIHCLKVWGALLEILRTRPVPARGFLLHAYSGPMEMVGDFASLGACFSFSGYFLNAKKAARREVFRQIPENRLLVETDAPAMPLPSERARWTLPDAPTGPAINHPANIAAVYEGLAEIRGLPVETLAARVAENFQRLFGVS